jgi:hypothetical protein
VLCHETPPSVRKIDEKLTAYVNYCTQIREKPTTRRTQAGPDQDGNTHCFAIVKGCRCLLGAMTVGSWSARRQPASQPASQPSCGHEIGCSRAGAARDE